MIHGRESECRNTELSYEARIVARRKNLRFNDQVVLIGCRHESLEKSGENYPFFATI
jgi:hypothetical protein